MDARTRWETEAIRDSTPRRAAPPKPSGSRRDPSRNWVTLREAEAATGIPANTLRKWARKSSLPSYLESDGEMAVRLVDLDAVVAHAAVLGREIRSVDEVDVDREVADHDEPAAGAPVDEERIDAERIDEGDDRPAAQPGTMIVPVDAWNKMLTQLGNLHEAGQQLAEARERAAKAETEVTFLRQRLTELRDGTGPPPVGARVDEPDRDPSATSEADRGSAEPPTTTYWRYVTAGWRHRKRRDRQA